MILFTLSATLLASSALVAKSPAPEGRTYFIHVIGFGDDPFMAEADCLTFDATQACTLDGQTCLDWSRIEEGRQTVRESGFTMSTEIDDEGLVITMEGQGRVDSRGPKSSIAAVGQAAALDQRMNFTFAGRQTSRSRCLDMVEDFQSQSTSR